MVVNQLKEHPFQSCGFQIDVNLHPYTAVGPLAFDMAAAACGAGHVLSSDARACERCAAGTFSRASDGVSYKGINEGARCLPCPEGARCAVSRWK